MAINGYTRPHAYSPLSPSAAHANRLTARKLAERLYVVATHNDVDTFTDFATNEIALRLDLASRRPATTVSDTIAVRGLVRELLGIAGARDFEIRASVIIAEWRRGLE